MLDRERTSFSPYLIIFEVSILKNEYTIEDDIVTIYMANNLTTTISTSDLTKLLNLNVTWYGNLHKPTGNIYAKTNIRVDGKKKLILMSRFLLNVVGDRSVVVDHRNHNTLDNTRTNIRAVTHTVNMRNFKPSRTGEYKSAVRGVCYKKKEGKWKASIGDTYLGLYNTREEAEEVRKNAEKTIWGIEK
jgi:hypothetical protein